MTVEIGCLVGFSSWYTADNTANSTAEVRWPLLARTHAFPMHPQEPPGTRDGGCLFVATYSAAAIGSASAGGNCSAPTAG